MADSTLNRFVAQGTTAQRTAFTPSAPTPASGPSPAHLWYDTDQLTLYTWQAGAWVAIGSMVLIGEKVCSGSTATETFSGISGAYRHLRVLFTGRVTSAGTANHNIYAQFNGDTAANYDLQTIYASNVTASGSQTLATATPAVFLAPEASVTTGLAGSGELTIPYYAGTTFHKTAMSTVTSKSANASGGIVVSTLMVHWRSTAAITSLVLGVTTSGNFASGSKLTLYGVN